jgi:sodium transport system ATP-binding protein
MGIDLSNVSKIFSDKRRGDVLALDDLNFTIPNGSVFGLLGLNGAGKTTTLRIICTLLKPQRGSVTVNGYDTCYQSEKVREQIGFLPSESSVYQRFSPREVFTYFARLCKYPEKRIRGRVDEVVELLAMQEFANSHCGKLSAGMKRKVALGRSIIHDPSVLILDEPTANLDVPTTLAVHRIVQDFRKQGKCILLSTHSMAEAEKLSDKIGIISKGRLVLNGRLDHLREATTMSTLEEIFMTVTKSVT